MRDEMIISSEVDCLSGRKLIHPQYPGHESAAHNT